MNNMYVEKRLVGKNTKYYLTRSYRDELGKVKKIRKFLGINLTKEDIKKSSEKAKKQIEKEVQKIKTNIFSIELTPRELKSLNKFNEKINVISLTKIEWKRFTEEFIYNTNAIEGSQVLLEEVPKILSDKKATNEDELETKGVAKAINFIRTTEKDLSLKFLLELHKLCFEKTKSFAGKFRKVEVVIRGRDGSIIHQGTLVKKLDEELKEFIIWYKNNKSKFKPLVLAAIVHNQFEKIHPFQDGNGRVGRLLLNFILIKNNYPPLNILVQDRAKYYKALYEYSQNDKLKPMLNFLLNQYKKTLKNIR